MIKKLALILLLLAEQAAPCAPLPKDLDTFLPAIPKALQSSYTKSAQLIKKAFDKKSKKKNALSAWKKIPASSPFYDIANYEIALISIEEKKYPAAKLVLEKILTNFPFSPFTDESKKLLEAIEWPIITEQSKAALHASPALKNKALEHAMNQLEKNSWKSWQEHEDLVALSLQLAREEKSPLLRSWQAEVLSALPKESSLRQQVAAGLGETELKNLLNLARFKPLTSPSGIKPVNPDAQLFEEAMNLVLQEKWKEAREAFQKILEQFPTTDLLDKTKFWIANCTNELGEKDKAKEKFQEIIQESPLSYYAYASAQKIDFDVKSLLKENAVPSTAVPLEGSLLPRQERSLWRIRALLEAGAFIYASQELEALFNYRPHGTSLGQATPQNMLLMAKLYFYGTYYLGSFSHSYVALHQDHSLLQKENLQYFFPAPYAELLQKYATQSGVDVNLIRSVIKQESGFIPSALSKSDAMGLMQLLPSTAKDLDNALEKKELLEEEKNISLGSAYLKKLLEKFSGNIPLTLAAYNAGPQRAQQWQKKLLESPAMKKEFRTDIFVDTIPYQETHKYVGNILRNIYWYKLLLN